NVATEALAAARGVDQWTQAYQRFLDTLAALVNAQTNVAAAQAKPGATGSTTTQTTGQYAATSVFGQDDTGTDITSLGQAFKDTTTSVKSLGNAAKAVSGVFDAVHSAYDQGGASAAIGAGMQSVGSMLGPTPAGEIISGVGSIISTISGIFEAAAQSIAQNAQRSFQQIQEAYSAGTINLAAAMQQEQQLINQTISSLSGQKGGQQQLQNILPGMESALNSLKLQAAQTMATFDEQ